MGATADEATHRGEPAYTWPWGHLALGYLVYSLAVHLRHRRGPDGVAAVALAFGTPFPDLVDKPLAWTLAILPHGHSLAHSLIIAIGLAVFALWLSDDAPGLGVVASIPRWVGRKLSA